MGRVRSALVVCVLMLLVACERVPEVEPMSGGNAERGRALIQQHGCGGCHTIAGIPGARGKVGPPLTDLRERVYLGGATLNNAENLTRRIMDPRNFTPITAMPATPVSEAQARDIVAYLYRH
jgi:cytochrome c